MVPLNLASACWAAPRSGITVGPRELSGVRTLYEAKVGTIGLSSIKTSGRLPAAASAAIVVRYCGLLGMSSLFTMMPGWLFSKLANKVLR